jgi:head-tail adaptor
MAFDPSTDFENIVDGLESIMLDRRGSDSEAITNALRRDITTLEASASNGKYTASDTKWHFPASAVDSMPRLGDVIEDANGERYTILEVQTATLGKRYRCVSRNVAVVYGLDCWVTIEKATYSKGTQGAIERAWAAWKKVRARIQPVDAVPEKSAGMQRTEKRYNVMVAENCDIDNSYRIKGPDGTLYRFEKSTQSEQIGGLQTIEVIAWRN